MTYDTFVDDTNKHFHVDGVTGNALYDSDGIDELTYFVLRPIEDGIVLKTHRLQP